jgi:hypothetical protein
MVIVQDLSNNDVFTLRTLSSDLRVQ